MQTGLAIRICMANLCRLVGHPGQPGCGTADVCQGTVEHRGQDHGSPALRIVRTAAARHVGGCATMLARLGASGATSKQAEWTVSQVVFLPHIPSRSPRLQRKKIEGFRITWRQCNTRDTVEGDHGTSPEGSPPRDKNWNNQDSTP